jgi:hypothetical protein
MVGKKFSECTPELLNALAQLFDWKAKKRTEEGDEKGASYARKDARLARGWARNLGERNPF